MLNDELSPEVYFFVNCTQLCLASMDTYGHFSKAGLFFNGSGFLYSPALAKKKTFNYLKKWTTPCPPHKKEFINF